METKDSKTFVKLFTVEEANRLLPILNDLIWRVVKTRDELMRMQPEIQRARSHAQENGGTLFGMEYLKRLELFAETIQTIETLGVIVKDYSFGLCDFPYMKDGQVVYLCWKLGEDKVRWWHEIETGFNDRKPIE